MGAAAHKWFDIDQVVSSIQVVPSIQSISSRKLFYCSIFYARDKRTVAKYLSAYFSLIITRTA